MSYDTGFRNGLAGIGFLAEQHNRAQEERRLQQDQQFRQQAFQTQQQGEIRKEHLDRMRELAGMLVTAPDAMKPQVYASLKPEFDAMGYPIPDQYSPDVLPIAQQVAGMGQGATGVQSSFVDAQGNRVAIMRDGSIKVLGQNAPNNQIIAGDGGFFGVNKGTLEAAPVTIGGNAPQAPQTAPQDVMGGLLALGSTPGVTMTSGPRTPAHNAEVGGVPNSQHMAGTAMDYAVPEAQKAAFIALAKKGGFQVIDEGDHIHIQVPKGPGRQLQPAPKAAAAGDTKAPNGYRWTANGNLEAIPGGPAQVAIDARQHAADAKIAAQQVRQAEAADSATQLTSAIDELTKSPGFALLGTATGDAEQMVPFVRNSAKDAAAQLHNIAGQVALTTMSKLKALSTQGATGFGALSEKELALLQNSIATLQSDKISNAQLRASLKTIRDSMQKIADWKGAAPANQPASPQAPASGDFSHLWTHP